MKTMSNISHVAWMAIVVACSNLSESNRTENLFLGEKISFENLELYPVLANETFLYNRRNVGIYLSLREAMEQGKVIVTEHVTPPSNEGFPEDEPLVNTLFIENMSGDTVLILDGEMVEGGNQNRVIAQDMVLPPHSGKLDLTVFCVEQGRWHGDDEIFFITEENLTSSDIRKAALVEKSQERVWQQVSEKISLLDIESPTMALSAINTHDDYNSHLESYRRHLGDVFYGHENVIGVIAVSGSEIIGCDLFATNALFTKHYHNLLQSYASDTSIESSRIAVTTGMVEEYLNDIVEVKAIQDGFTMAKGKESKGKYKAHLSAF